jgi:hypothetical protein
MKHFVLFSMLLIAASVIVLAINPYFNPNPMEGFESEPMEPMEPMEPNPVPATFSNAAAADGTSDQDHLMYNTLNKQERLSKTLESQINDGNNSNGVSPTTTKKNGIATSSSTIESFQGMSTTCSDKCKEIKAADAIRGNCVNPKLPDKNPDYSTKYCPAFLPNDPLTYAQECAKCGYHKYSSECLRYADPKDPNKCTKYGSYTPSQSSYMTCAENDPICNLFHGVGTQDDGTSGNTGPTCSAANCAPKEVTVGTNKCVIPGCISMDSGMLPYPMDFYGNDQINPCTGKGASIKCPAITPGTFESYDSGGGSGDPCYTTGGKVDPAKFQSMNQVPICNRVKKQNFVPSQPQQDQPQKDQKKKDQKQQKYLEQQRPQKDQKQQRPQQDLEQQKYQRQKYLERRRQMKRNNVPEPEPGTLYLGIF